MKINMRRDSELPVFLNLSSAKVESSPDYNVVTDLESVKSPFVQVIVDDSITAFLEVADKLASMKRPNIRLSLEYVILDKNGTPTLFTDALMQEIEYLERNGPISRRGGRDDRHGRVGMRSRSSYR